MIQIDTRLSGWAANGRFFENRLAPHTRSLVLPRASSFISHDEEKKRTHPQTLLIMTFNIPLGRIAPPPQGTLGTSLTVLQSLLVASRFQLEVRNPAPYSKFALDIRPEQDPVPSQQGMFIAYFPATLIALFKWAESNQQNVAALLLFLHFAKRVMEVLFLHSYSGYMARSMSALMAVFYSFDTLLIASLALPANKVDNRFMIAGAILFAIGEFGNFFHHYLLAALREKKGGIVGRRYQSPSGGFFSLVAAPHYLFEVISWLGVAFCSQQVNAFLEVLSHASYLAGRAYRTNMFYFRTFSDRDWPRCRKCIFPFIF